MNSPYLLLYASYYCSSENFMVRQFTDFLHSCPFNLFSLQFIAKLENFNAGHNSLDEPAAYGPMEYEFRNTSFVERRKP